MTFTDILDQYGIPYISEGERHCRPGWVSLACPFCGPGSGKHHWASLGYNIDGNFCTCWRCRGHSVFSTLIELTGEPVGKVRQLLQGIEGAPKVERIDIRGNLTMPQPIADKLSRAHLEYLRSRGFEKPRALAALWSLQGLNQGARVKTPEGAKINLSWRILIPYLYNGKTVSWTTRSISEEVSQRYIAAPASCEAVDHKTLLYGEDNAKHAVCAVEGEFDAMRVGPGGVGVGGTAYKAAQVLRLSRYNVRGVWFDNEPDAQIRARELVDALSVFPGETYNIVGDSKDPGSASQREIEQVRKALGL